MKKRIALFVMICLSTMVLPVVAEEGRVGKWDLGVYGAGALNLESGVEDTGYYGLNLAYGITPWLAAGASGGWQNTGVASDENLGQGVLMGDVILRAPRPFLNNLVPYAVFGLGAIGSYVENEDGAPATSQGDDVDDLSFGWRIGGGVDWLINPAWIGFFEVSHYESDPELTNSTVREGSDFTTVGGGMKYSF